eukprot:TRINITY_DN1234_c0_g4_i1.p1 TRINITY_DN1234_c0_g4~~TRINITY_DN1234_c0_g4_i1.p1  ORF type:complete len:207 (-),score=70.29 TRINITY_DN1234_c0_g4_i1:68-688(-)
MSTEGNCCVFVGNLAYSVNDAALQEHMSQAGEVVSAIVLRMGSRSKGCGLVEYASAEDAENAQKTLTETELEGRNIFVREDREAGKKSFNTNTTTGDDDDEDETNNDSLKKFNQRFNGRGGFDDTGRLLYIGNIPYQTSWQDLKDIFREYGDVIRADVVIGRDGRPRGFGTVLMADVDGATNAIEGLNGSQMGNRTIEVRYDRYTN